MPNDAPKKPPLGDPKPVAPRRKRVELRPEQQHLPGGLKPRPGGKGGKPPRFPGRTGGR